MPFVTLPDGVRLYYETKGAGEPLLLVMGRASDHLGWGPVPQDFADRWQVEADIASGNMLRVLTKFYNPLWMLTHLNELAAMQPATEPIPAYAEEMHGRASAAHDSWDRLPAISAPTLVIHGGRDEVAPTANAHRLAERIPGAELHLVPRGRHMFNLEFRAEVDRVIGDFLRRHPLLD